MPTLPRLKSETLISFFILFLCLLIYLPGLNNDFVGDDLIFVNPSDQYHYQSWADYFTASQDQHYYPVYYLLNVNLFRYFFEDIRLLRLISICLFYVSCLLVYRLIITLTESQRTAFLTAVLYCLHPFSSPRVLLISNSFLSVYILSLCASLVYFWDHLKSPSRKQSNLILSSVFFVLALLTFEGAWLFPLQAFCAVYFIKKKKFAESLRLTFPFFFLALIHFVFWYSLILHQSNLGERVASFNLSWGGYLASIAFLLKWLATNYFWPQSVVHIYNHIPEAGPTAFLYLALLAACSILIILVLIRWGRGIKSFALTWFLAGFLLMTAGCFSQSYMGMVIEPHWFSFSLIGLFLLTAALFNEALNKSFRKISLAVIILWFCYLFVTAQKYVDIASTQKKYNEFWLKVCPLNPLPMQALAGIYANEGRTSEALNLYNRILQESNLKKDEIYASLGKIYFNKKDLTQAEHYIALALAHNAKNAQAYFVLGHIARIKGDLRQAEENFQKAWELGPYELENAFALIDTYMLQGKKDEAVNFLKNLLKTTPRMKEGQAIRERLLKIIREQ